MFTDAFYCADFYGEIQIQEVIHFLGIRITCSFFQCKFLKDQIKILIQIKTRKEDGETFNFSLIVKDPRKFSGELRGSGSVQWSPSYSPFQCDFHYGALLESWPKTWDLRQTLWKDSPSTSFLLQSSSPTTATKGQIFWQRDMFTYWRKSEESICVNRADIAHSLFQNNFTLKNTTLLKVLVVLRLIYAISIKSQQFLKVINNMILKYKWKCKELRTGKSPLKKSMRKEKITFPLS